MIRSRAFPAALFAASMLAACSGGTASSPAPQATATLAGLGSTPTLDQTTNFTVVVPPLTTTSAVAAAAKKRLAASSVTNPYVSPQTASVVLQLGSVDGVSLLQAPPPNPPVNIPATCVGSKSGCTIPIQNVKAAKGVNRFQIETFSGQSGSGNLISTGYIDVAVPSATSASFGGTALSIGGFTAQLSLALSPVKGFVSSIAASASVDVNAIDPGGAIIIGNSLLANPITLQLGGADVTNFTLAGGTQVTLAQSMQSVALAYDGKISPGSEVDASTIDENGAAVATTLPIAVATPTPTPRPTPLPTTAPTPTPPGATPTPYRTPLSIYVYDASSDNIVEYDGVRQIEAGYRPSPVETPRRAFVFAVDPNTYSNCAVIVGGNNAGPNLGGIAVLANGTIYAQSKCTDPALTLAYTFSYPATTRQLSTPPPAAPALAAPLTNPGVVAQQPLGIKLDTAHNKVFVAYPDAQGNGPNLLGFSIGSPVVANNVAATCLSELGQTTNCSSFGPGYSGGQANFALDGAGYAYAPVAYNDIPPGTAGQQVQGEAAIVSLNLGASNPVAYPFSALAGLPDDIGAVGAPSAVVAIEGTTLYALGAPGQVYDFNDPNVPTQWAGLSNCTAPPDPVVPQSALTACSDTIAHTYLIAFAGGTTTLTSTAAGQDLVAAPAFELGGDAANGGNFGTSTYGDILTVVDGFAYVANAVPSANSPISPPYAAEIDVYDVRSVTGAHADLSASPLARILLPASVYPTAIAIGPTGPVTGGLQILSHGARPHRNIGAWVRARQLRLRQLQMQNRSRRHRKRGWFDRTRA